MKSKSWFKTNFIYGLIALIPFAVLALLLVEVVELLRKLAAALGLESTLGAGAAVAAGLVLVVLLCLGVGMAVGTRLGTWSFRKAEELILERIPGYELIGNILKGFARDADAYPAVMLHLHGPGTAVLGFVMDKHENGILTVFAPSTPALTMGTVHLVGPERVTYLETKTVELANCLSQWGIGSAQALRGVRL